MGTTCTLEHVFDNVHRSLARPFDPAVDVWVHVPEIYRPWLERVDPPPGPLVDEKGLGIPLKVPGVLHGWIRARRGAWLGLVPYSLPTTSAVGPIRMRHLVPKDAVTRRWPDGEEPF